MQRKSILTSILYFLLGNCAIMAQNSSLQEIKLKEYGSEAFVNFKDIMEDHDIFLIGEDFEKELKSNDFKFKLIEYLNKNEKVNGILLERGIAEIHYINKYINGGSLKYLEMQEEHFRERDIKFFQYLRSYNENNTSTKLQIFGLAEDKYEEMEILYLDEIIYNPNSNDGNMSKVHAAAMQVYNKNNFTEALINPNEFESVSEEVIDYKSLIYNTVLQSSIIAGVLDQNKVAFQNFIKNKNTSFGNKTLIPQNNYRYFHATFPELKFIAHLPWCNLEAERGHRECDVYAYSGLINLKEEFKVYSVLTLQVLPHSFQKRTLQFNGQILNAAENNYNYSGFKSGNDPLIDYVILTKSTLSSTRKTLYFEELGTKDYLSFYINYGLVGYVNNDIEALNTSIKNSHPGFSDFKTELGHRYIDLTLDYSGYVTKISHKWTNQDPVILNLQESVQFNQKSTTVYFGYNVLRHKRNLLAPMIGIGYANTRLKYEVTSNTSNPPFTQFSTSNYENPAFIMDYSIELNLATKNYVGIGFNIGYVTDLSSKQWRLNGSNMSNTPAFSSSGFHAGFSALININKNIKK